MSFLGMFFFILSNFSMMDAGVLQGHREIGEDPGHTPDTPQLRDLSQVHNTLT